MAASSFKRAKTLQLDSKNKSADNILASAHDWWIWDDIRVPFCFVNGEKMKHIYFRAIDQNIFSLGQSSFFRGICFRRTSFPFPLQSHRAIVSLALNPTTNRGEGRCKAKLIGIFLAFLLFPTQDLRFIRWQDFKRFCRFVGSLIEWAWIYRV